MKQIVEICIKYKDMTSTITWDEKAQHWVDIQHGTPDSPHFAAKTLTDKEVADRLEIAAELVKER